MVSIHALKFALGTAYLQGNEYTQVWYKSCAFHVSSQSYLQLRGHKNPGQKLKFYSLVKR